MKVALVKTAIPDLLPMRGRSPGLHVSDVIHDIAVRLGYRKEGGGADMSRMQLGLALEHAIITRYALDNPGRYWQLGEMQCDGLYGTSDLFDAGGRDRSEPGPDEIKLTWESSRWLPCELDEIDFTRLTDEVYSVAQGIVSSYRGRLIAEKAEFNERKYWARLAQLKSYCYMTDSLVGRLHMGHIMGAWSWEDFRVDYRVWELEFTAAEINDNWQMITTHADRMRAEGKHGYE